MERPTLVVPLMNGPSQRKWVHPTIGGDFGLSDGRWIYGGMAPMSHVPVLNEAPGRDPRPGPDSPLAHWKPGYSLAGCFPAEPASASSGRVLQRVCVLIVGVPTPKGSRLVAQGCPRSGKPWVGSVTRDSTPTGLRHTWDATPLGLIRIPAHPPRVFRCAADPGLQDETPLGSMSWQILNPPTFETHTPA